MGSRVYLRSSGSPRACGTRRRLKVEDGGWRVEDGGWRVESGEWRVEGAGCRVEGGWWRVEGAGRRVKGAGWRVKGRGWRAMGDGWWVQDVPPKQWQSSCVWHASFAASNTHPAEM